jgi:cytochrome c2
MKLAIVVAATLAAGSALAQQAPGETLFKKANCQVCHGAERKGSTLAPPLLGLSKSWDADRLAAYLADPYKVSKGDARLEELEKKFPAVMPPYGAPEGDRKALAAWLLEAGK